MNENETRQIKLLNGNCKDKLKELDDNSVDSIVTDPPYELGFMGKSWDSTGIAYDKEMWKECLRVLKPGGHLLSFGGTRTYHRMAVAIEDAGFEIRDQIQWLYGSGFPKSHNIYKNLTKSIIDNGLWKKNLKDALNVTPQLKRNQIEVGNNIEKRSSVQDNVVPSIKIIKELLNVIIVELHLNDHHHTSDQQITTAVQNAVQKIKRKDLTVTIVEKVSQDLNHILKDIEHKNDIRTTTALKNVLDLDLENITDKIREGEVQKILSGEKKFSNEEITNAICVAALKDLKLTILNQSKIFQSLGTKSQMECVSAISVTTTKSTMEHLIGNTESIVKENLKRFEGQGTALKPANEPICVARKPLSENTIAENVLKHGTGGLNIDDCRITLPDGDDTSRSLTDPTGWKNTSKQVGSINDDWKKGRFPANIILDEEAGKQLDEQSGNIKGNKPMEPFQSPPKNDINLTSGNKVINRIGYDDEGGASRFFYCPKVSKTERNEGLGDEFEEKQEYVSKMKGDRYIDDVNCADGKYGAAKAPTKNNHPTVKPVDLMAYLIRLVTPKEGTVLDPFMGSGSTGKAAMRENMNFIGIEMEKDSYDIAKARIEWEKGNNKHYEFFEF